MDKLLEIVFEDETLLVVNKPAGLVCHPTKTDERSSLIGRARLHLGPAGAPRMVNRLDRETSGIVLIAKTVEAARELGRLWEGQSVRKEYQAIVHGSVRTNHGLIEAPVAQDTASAVAIKDCVHPDGAPAVTEFHVERRFRREDADYSLLRIAPRTGRKHQIRVHLAHLGHPIVGDKLYGLDERLYLRFVVGQLTPEDWCRLVLPHHALHAGTLRFTWRDRDWCFEAPPEPWFRGFVGAGQQG